jgi:hypothetical protein
MAYHGIPGMSLAVIEGGRIAWALPTIKSVG